MAAVMVVLAMEVAAMERLKLLMIMAHLHLIPTSQRVQHSTVHHHMEVEPVAGMPATRHLHITQDIERDICSRFEFWQGHHQLNAITCSVLASSLRIFHPATFVVPGG